MAESESQQDPTQEDPQDTGGQPTPQHEQEPPADTGKSKAPWERDGGEFDPETAWKLIQNLREENSGLKKKNREYEDAKLTEQQKAERDLAETREQIARLQADKAWADARARHPELTDTDRELVGDGTPEQIGQRADMLAKRITAQAAASQTGAGRRPAINYAQPTGGSDPTRTPGHTDWMREALDNNR